MRVCIYIYFYPICNIGTYIVHIEVYGVYAYICKHIEISKYLFRFLPYMQYICAYIQDI